MLPKLSLSITLAASAFVLSGAIQAATTCADKQQAIQQQIGYANLHGNTQQAAGLQKALSETREHCTEQGLRADLEDQVRQKQRKVMERQDELAEARASGKPDKIAKKQRRLSEAQDELQAAQDALR
jgi:hypothetical protein